MDNSFNLIDEKWIPSNLGMVSILDCFTNSKISNVGRNSVEKISMFKFLLAISHGAVFLNDKEEQLCTCIENFKDRVIDYLGRQHDNFFLYGENPFCQFKFLKDFKDEKYQSYGEIAKFMEEIATGNNNVLFISNVLEKIKDSDRALTLINNLGSGQQLKINANDEKISVKLTKNEDYLKFWNGVKVSEYLCVSNFLENGFDLGIIHGYLMFDSILKSLYYNMFNEDCIVTKTHYSSIGKPAWEIPITGEDDERYKSTYMSELLPFNRFMLLEKDSDLFFRTEGIRYETERIKNQLDLFKFIKNTKDGERLANSICRVDGHALNSVGASLLFNNGFWNQQIIHSFDIAQNKEEKSAIIWIGGAVVKNKSSDKSIVDYNESSLFIKDFEFFNDNVKICNYFDKLNSFNIMKGIADNLTTCFLREFGMTDKIKSASSFFKNILCKFISENSQTLLDAYYEENNEKIGKINCSFITLLKSVYEMYCNNKTLTNQRGKSFYEIYYKYYPEKYKLTPKKQKE